MKNMYILMAMLMTSFALAQEPAPVVLDVASDGSAANSLWAEILIKKPL